MSNGSVYLNGSEDVRRAGSSIASAAEDMRQAANLMCESVMVLKLALNDHANQMRDIMEEHRQEMAKMLSTVARVDENKLPDVVSVFNFNNSSTDCPYCLVPEGSLHLAGCSKPRTPE